MKNTDYPVIIKSFAITEARLNEKGDHSLSLIAIKQCYV